MKNPINIAPHVRRNASGGVDEIIRLNAQALGLLVFVLSLLGTIRVGTQTDDVAFVNVNVIPMDRERVLAAQTVWISGGRIKAMGAVREIALPRGVHRVDGTKKYLMPGLADMHGHLTHRGPTMAYPLETFPLLLIAHGVTTLRNRRTTEPCRRWAGAVRGAARRDGRRRGVSEQSE